MHYFIDGYNLLFRRLRAGGELQIQREFIIRELDECASFLELDITIVFDSQHQYGLGTRTHYHHIEICFTDEGETADDYILKALKRVAKSQQETVITSDKRLAWQVRRRLAKTESVEQFLKWVIKRSQNKTRRLKQEAAPPISQPPTPQPKVTKSIPAYESDMDRWQRIFEERLREPDDGDSH